MVTKEFHEHVINLSVNGKQTEFRLKCNMDGNTMAAAVNNWAARVDPNNATLESFCEYINRKGVHKATPIKTTQQ